MATSTGLDLRLGFVPLSHIKEPCTSSRPGCVPLSGAALALSTVLAALPASLPRRKKSAAKGKRRRDLPEEVTSRLGEANMLYATGRNHEAIAKLMEASKPPARAQGARLLC